MDQDNEKPKCEHPFTTGIIRIDRPGYYQICRGCFKPILKMIRGSEDETLQGLLDQLNAYYDKLELDQ